MAHIRVSHWIFTSTFKPVRAWDSHLALPVPPLSRELFMFFVATNVVMVEPISNVRIDDVAVGKAAWDWLSKRTRPDPCPSQQHFTPMAPATGMDFYNLEIAILHEWLKLWGQLPGIGSQYRLNTHFAGSAATYLVGYLQVSYYFSAGGRPYHFLDSTSLSILLSRASSAYMCFSLRFSSSSSLSLRRCSPSIPEYFFFQLHKVCGLMPSSRLISDTERPFSASLIAFTIWLSVNLVFFKFVVLS